MKSKIYLYFIYSRLKFLYILSTLFISMHDLSYQSEIRLVIKGQGNLFFLNSDFSPEPCEVIINNVTKESCKRNCIFTKDINNVVIKFCDQIDSCENMFNGLDNIIDIDLSNFDTSKVTNMYAMFNGSTYLEKINFGKIDTSLVKTMEKLFNYCVKLITIDISNFDTSSVTNMFEMFAHCESLTSIDASNFDTKNVENMKDMFGYCYKLITVNVSNFDTSKVKNIQGMFFACRKLKYLDLSSFYTPSVTIFDYFFAYDYDLAYIKLNHLSIKEGVYISDNILIKAPSNLKICVEDDIAKSKFPESEQSKFDCSHDCFKNDIKIDLETNSCVEDCSTGNFKYQHYNFCYNKCPDASYLSRNNEYLCLDKSSEGVYYFDSAKGLYKECYKTCKRCTIGGNETFHNCNECNDNNSIEFKINDYSNCFQNCPYHFYFDNYNNYQCTDNSNCPTEFPLLDKRECKISNENKIKEAIENSINEINQTDEINFYNAILKTIDDYFTSNDYVTSNLDNGNDEILKMGKVKIIFTTTENQKNNLDSNMINIDLGECENSLRKNYNLTKNETLYIKMLK